MTGTHYWRVEGFDGTKLIFESDIRHYLLSETQVEELLGRLVSRNHTENEIVGASLNRKTKRTALLDKRLRLHAAETDQTHKAILEVALTEYLKRTNA